MKKKLVLVLTVISLAGTFVTGCADAKQETEKIESEVKKEGEKVESEVNEDAETVVDLGSTFISNLQNDLVNIEAAAATAIDAGEKDLKTIEEEAAAAIEKLKETIEKDAGEAKNEALNLLSGYEERLQRLF